jgi:hypothetical protein
MVDIRNGLIDSINARRSRIPGPVQGYTCKERELFIKVVTLYRIKSCPCPDCKKRERLAVQQLSFYDSNNRNGALVNDRLDTVGFL